MCIFYNIFTIENFWSIAQTILWWLWIYIAYLIYKRQEYNSNKDQELNRALSSIIALNIDINTWQRKLEYTTSILGKFLEQWEYENYKILENEMKLLKKTIDDYYNKRDKLIKQYNIILWDRLE